MSDPAHADRSVRGKGTPAADWRRWSHWPEPPTVDVDELVPPGSRLLVVAPHPDDEVLGCGGLLRLAVRAAREVRVLLATSGQASHPGSTRWPAERLAAAREAESRAALAELGVPAGSVMSLGFLDGSLARQQAEVSREVVRELLAGDVVVTPWRWDGHPDHEVIAGAVVDVLPVLPATHLQVPIWGWHWARPGDDMLPWSRAARLRLDPTTQAAKASAVDYFESQLRADPSTGRAAVLPDWALARLVTDTEIYFR